jgi:hypothetical protein
MSTYSYNCRGFNFAKVGYINQLMRKCDVLFVQEHWQSAAELKQSACLNPEFLCHVTCGFGNTEVLTGRQFGGCAIFWRPATSGYVDVIPTDSQRVCAIRMTAKNWKLLFINVYMPYDGGEDHADDFSTQLAVIEYVINSNADCHIALGGDFNVDFSRNRYHTKLLQSFCGKIDLSLVTQHVNCQMDYMYIVQSWHREVQSY